MELLFLRLYIFYLAIFFSAILLQIGYFKNAINYF